MNVSDFRDYCLSKNGVTEGFPFDSKTLVFKVGNKMFALANVDDFNSINLKCSPERALELRETHHGITPGYHMNKTHWNTVAVHQDVSPQLIRELINHSYDLVFSALSKKVKNELSH